MGSRRVIHSLITLGGLAAMASLAAMPLGGTGLPAAPPTALSGRMVPAVDMGSGPLVHTIAGPNSSGAFSCQSASAPLPCYGPAQIRRAYDIPGNLTGAGETVV